MTALVHTPAPQAAQHPVAPAEPFRVFAFGAGVQTMALLYAWLLDSIIMPRDEQGWADFEGFFDGHRPDLVAFGDTQCEPMHVYDAVEEAKHLCEQANIPFIVVSKGNLAAPPPASTGTQGIYTPVYTKQITAEADPDGYIGKKGQLRRQCTAAYKIEPVIEYAKTLAGTRTIEITLGISVDEAHRMKRRDPDDQIQLRYPLIFDRLGPMSRHDCVNLLRDLEVSAAKSACVFCPYRRDAWWAKMYREDPEAFAKAVEYDRWVRDKRPGFECYVHDSLQPLEDVVPAIVAAQDQQIGLFPIDLDTSGSGGCEEGFCGV